MCSKGYDPYYAEDLQEDTYDKARRELMPAVTRISITGFGEPAMGGKFEEILQMSLDNGSEVHFVTNASLQNFERLEKLTSKPVEIIISIDGATKETFEKVRVNSNFELIREKLAMIRKLSEVAMSGFISHFSMHFVALQMNIHVLPGVVRMAHEGLFVKLTYWLDYRVAGCWRGRKRCSTSIIRGQMHATTAAPNFHLGKPIKATEPAKGACGS